MHLAHRAIWIWFLLLPLISTGQMELLTNHAAHARAQISSSRPPLKDALFVDVSVDYGAQLTLIDSQGRTTGYDSATGKTLAGIPDSSYGDDSISDATDDSPDGATAESRVLEIHPKIRGQYLLKVSATDRDSYRIQFFCSTGEGNPTNISVPSLGIASREVHSFVLAIAPDCSGKLVSGAFSEQNGSGSALLTYAHPLANHVSLNRGNPFRLVLVYDGRISPTSFSATLNGTAISKLFHPSPNTIEAVAILVKTGHNLIQLSIAGPSEHGSALVHTDSFVVDAD